MSDRELLELAAKAVGVKYDAEASKPHPKSRAFWGLWLVIRGEPSEHQRRYWNPLTHDGDALRLAVKLNLRLECMTMQTAASTFDRKISEPVDHTVEKECVRWPFEQCPYAATRRAITRAAAEIGKEMP